jgi:transposase-like protein
VIVFAFRDGVNGYQTAFAAGHLYKLEECPLCAGTGCLVGHGVYWRKPRDGERAYWIPIQRWLCKTCGHTISALPDFLLRHRWYLLEAVSKVIVKRAEGGATWRELGAAAEGSPHVRTMQRWWQSMGGEAVRWLGAMETALAQQDSSSVWLDPQGEAAQAHTPVQALLDAAGHLLAWGKTSWEELVEYGWKDRLRFLWLWGSGQGLGRLV